MIFRFGTAFTVALLVLQFLHMKAWQLTAGWFVIITAIATFVFKFAGKEELMMLCSGGVCLMVTLYWVSYFYLRKKY